MGQGRARAREAGGLSDSRGVGSGRRESGPGRRLEYASVEIAREGVRSGEHISESGLASRSGSPTRAPRPATPGEISDPRPATPSDLGRPAQPRSQRLYVYDPDCRRARRAGTWPHGLVVTQPFSSHNSADVSLLTDAGADPTKGDPTAG